jgi:cytochrome c biogenesis protein CcdA
MRLLRFVLPILGTIIMMVANGNQTMMTVAYVILGAAALVWVLSFFGEAAGPKIED